jgi:large subunit ribosomal protein L18
MPVLTVREARKRRHRRVRAKIRGTAGRPRLVVSRSNKGISAQLVDDTAGATLVSASWRHLQETFEGNKTQQATEVGSLLAENAKKVDIGQAVFDRSGYLYHGRVRALAEAARKGGLEF